MGLFSDTLNIECFAQYIFLHRALDAYKFDESENYNNKRTNRIEWYVHKNVTA